MGAYVDGAPVATDRAGNIYVAGNIYGPNVSFDTFAVNGNIALAKYTPSGLCLWAKGMTGGKIINITTDSHNDLIVFGALAATGGRIDTFFLRNPLDTSVQYFIIKIDASGKVLWIRNEGSAQDGIPVIAGMLPLICTGGVTTDSADNIYITANTHLKKTFVGDSVFVNGDSAGNSDDILLAKYDASGTLDWAKCFGSDGNDDAYGITVTPGGDIYLAGVFTSAKLSFGATSITDSGISSNPFIARFDNSGNSLWSCSGGGNGSAYALSLACDRWNNVYMTGSFIGPDIKYGGSLVTNPYYPSPSLYLIKIDTANKLVWTKIIGASGREALAYGLSASLCGDVWLSAAMKDSVIIEGKVVYAPKGDEDPAFLVGYNAAGILHDYATLQSGGDDDQRVAFDPTSGNVYTSSDCFLEYLTQPFIVGPDTLARGHGSGESLYLAKFRPRDTIYYHVDTTVCGTEISAVPGYNDYLWNDGTGDVTDQLQGSGIYTVVCSNNCTFAKLIETFQVVKKEARLTTSTRDTIICKEDMPVPVTLKAPRENAAITWSTGADTSQITVTDTGTYWVLTTDNTCTLITEDTVNISAQYCHCWAVVPTAFSPNADGVNDAFAPLFGVACTVTKYALNICDRWGRVVYTTTDPKASWDGTYNGINADIGVYFWTMEYTAGLPPQQHFQKGNLTLIR
jgi:gliding motility-associated-like protein